MLARIVMLAVPNNSLAFFFFRALLKNFKLKIALWQVPTEREMGKRICAAIAAENDGNEREKSTKTKLNTPLSLCNAES